jgi:hypothetical protein
MLAIPAQAEPSSLKVVNSFVKLVKKGDYRQAQTFMAEKIVWQNQNHPDGNASLAGAYGIYLAVAAIQVGQISSVSCSPVDDIEVSCDFTRVSMFGGATKHLIERYFVGNSKIVKVINVIPPEMARLGKNG